MGNLLGLAMGAIVGLAKDELLRLAAEIVVCVC
jgi:hypothetical protein